MKRAALLVAAALIVLGCAPPNQVVGDSISTKIPATSSVYIDASSGRTTYSAGYGPGTGSGLEKVQQLAPRVAPGGWVIIELGTNDVAVGSSVEDMRVRVMNLARAVPTDRCLAFVTVARSNPAYRERIYAWNQFTRWYGRERHRCWAIIEWAAQVAAFPGMLSSDGIHPSPAGYRWLFGEYQRVAAL